MGYLISLTEQNTYFLDIGYVEVSCKTRHNIRKLANFIYDSVFDLRSQQGSSKLLLEEKIPATYLALEDVIASIARGLLRVHLVLCIFVSRCFSSGEGLNLRSFSF